MGDGSKQCLLPSSGEQSKRWVDSWTAWKQRYKLCRFMQVQLSLVHALCSEAWMGPDQDMLAQGWTHDRW